MLNFDFIILKLFLEENADFLLNARIQKIQQPTRRELIFTLRNHGETRKLYINISPQFFHVCFMSIENYQKRFIEQKKHQGKKCIYPPPMFCMLLRKYLESAKIAKVLQPEGERILEFYFETYNELNEKIYLCLAIELMGKHSNVVLYNYDTNVIIGCAHNVGSDKSRERELIGGLPYTYPPKHIRTSFLGLSSILSGKSINEFIDNYFADSQEKEKIKSIKSKLLTTTKNKLKKIDSSFEKIKKQTKTPEKSVLYKKYGDLIVANLYNNKDFSNSIEAFDYETNFLIKIKLDKTKTLKENANEYYKLYKKNKTASLKTDEMLKNLQIEREHLEQILYSIESSETINELMETSEEDKRHRGIEARGNNIFTPYTSTHPHARASKNLPSAIHHSPFTIFVGKNNKQNDYIVSKLARDEDLWFHVHNCAGSHVLLRIESGQTVTDEIIFECAKLAKEYSVAKNSSKVGVIYTKAKNLKKPSGSPLGYVTFKNEKEIIID